MKLADDADIDAALCVILDRAVERGGEVSMGLRVRIVAAAALFPVAVRDASDASGGHSYRCANTRHILGSVGIAPDGVGRQYVAKVHTYATKTSRVELLPGRHRRHADAMAELERALVALGWTVLDLARWREEAAPAAAYKRRLLPLPGLTPKDEVTP